MADKSADHEKNDTQKSSPAKVDHPHLNKLPADDIPDKMPDKKTCNGDQDINENRKDISAENQVGHTAIKC